MNSTSTDKFYDSFDNEIYSWLGVFKGYFKVKIYSY